MTKKSVRYVFSPYLLLLCLFCLPASAQTPAPKPSDPIPAWTASDSQLQMLGAEITHSGFKIRLPVGYNEVPVPPDAGDSTPKYVRHAYMWRGQKHFSGGVPTVVVTVTMLLTSTKQSFTAESVVKTGLRDESKGVSSFIESKIEDGLINGNICARAYYKGVYADPNHQNGTSREGRGFVYGYWNTQTNTAYYIEGYDLEPYYNQTSKELEAAALTLKPDQP